VHGLNATCSRAATLPETMEVLSEFNRWTKEQIQKQERNNDLEWKMEGKSERGVKFFW
jgi:hypothetical protein